MADSRSLIFTSSNSTSIPNTPDSTTSIVSPNSSVGSHGTSLALAVTVTDTSSSPTTPTGTILWGDNNAGGTFNPPTCILSSGSCSTSYTISANSPSSITITANYQGDSSHVTSVGASTITISQIKPTSTSITPSTTTIQSGGTTQYTVQVTDTSSSPTALSGTLTWSDNNAGGSFNPSTCALPFQTCVSTYSAPTNPPNAITITATYSGDSGHQSSSGTSHVSTNEIDATATKVIPNPATFTSGSTVSVTASVTDISNPSSNMIGIISWSDGGAGGIFNPNNCILASNKCAITYTPPSNSASSVTITASYAGDSSHSGSFGTALISEGSTSTQPSSPSTTSTPSQTTPSSSPTTQSPTTQPTLPPAASSTNTSPTTSTPSSPTNPSSASTSSTTQSPIQSSPQSHPPVTPSSSSTTQSPPQSTSATTTPSTQHSQTSPSSAASSTTQPDTSTQSRPTTSSPSTAMTAPSVHQVVNMPEEILYKVITMLESIFKNI